MHGIGEIVEYARASGLLGLVRAGFRQLVFDRQRLILTCRSLEEPIPELPLPEGLELRRATPEDVGQLHRLLSTHGFWRSTATLRSQIEEPNVPLLTTHGGDIVGFTCATADMPGGNAALRRAVRLGRDEAWGAGVFVVPEHRGRGIAPALLTAAMARCRAAGYRRFCSFVLAHNVAARAANSKVGYREVSEMILWRVLLLSGVRVTRLTEDGRGRPDPQPR